MALTKVGKEGITGISNASDATFLTATSAEGVTLAGTLAVTGVHTVGTNAVATSEGGVVTTSIVQGLAKHWCSLNGTSTIAIRDSFNTASIGDGGNGTYTITSTNPFGTAGDQCVTAAIVANKMQIDSTPTATATTLVSKNNDNTNTDSAYVSMSCTGDLA